MRRFRCTEILMSETKRVAVVGAGSWGTAVANVFADQGCDVVIWGRDADVISSINDRNENSKYLRGVKLSSRLRASDDLDKTLARAEIVVCSIPTQHIRGVFTPLREHLDGKLVVNTSKGIELGTHARVSQIFSEIAPGAAYAVLSGPSFALEVAQRLPAAVTVASTDADTSVRLQKLLSNQYFRVYTCPDVIGVEFAGALKNVVAIASGVVTGLKLGYNAQAAIINRGIAEIMRMAKGMGGQPFTFLGLAGMGDLILTCTGPLSRNRRLGLALGEGKNLTQIQQELGGVAEGVYTARSAYELAAKANLEMPITEQVYRVIYEGNSAQNALKQLMGRDLKEEWERLSPRFAP